MSSRSAIACLLTLLAAGCTKESAPPEQANAAAETSPDEAAPAAPSVKAGAVDRSHKGEAAPTVALTDLDGKATTLAAWRGKPVLVNLWATWCAPCVAEMPTLDKAAARVTTLVLNQGEDAAKVRPFIAKIGLAHARPLLDSSMAVSLGMSANLPTTILYDAAGKEVWRVTGGRDWTSAESVQLLGEAA